MAKENLTKIIEIERLGILRRDFPPKSMILDQFPYQVSDTNNAAYNNKDIARAALGLGLKEGNKVRYRIIIEPNQGKAF
jgi:hypothetical protein